MNIKSKTSPVFFIDNIPDILNTDRKELLRFITINAKASEIFIWLNQLRVAPYSYDFLDNRCQKSPHFIIEKLPDLKINNHFLLAFHIYAFEENRFLVGRFCEPINTPHNLCLTSLFMEYRLVEQEGKTQLWCKLKGCIKKGIVSKVFFLMFSVFNKIMITRQFKTIKKLSEKLALGEIERKIYDPKSNYSESGLHWWIFCRRHNCKGLLP